MIQFIIGFYTGHLLEINQNNHNPHVAWGLSLTTNWSTFIEMDECDHKAALLFIYLVVMNWFTYWSLNELINSTKEPSSTGENRIRYGTRIREREIFSVTLCPESLAPPRPFVKRIHPVYPGLLTSCPQKAT